MNGVPKVDILLLKPVVARNRELPGEAVELPEGMRLAGFAVMDGRRVTGVAIPVPWGLHQLHWLDFEYKLMAGGNGDPERKLG